MNRIRESLVGGADEKVKPIDQENPSSMFEGVDMSSLLMNAKTPCEAWDAIRGPELRAGQDELDRLHEARQEELDAFMEGLNRKYEPRIQQCETESQRLRLERGRLQVDEYRRSLQAMDTHKLVDLLDPKNNEGGEIDPGDGFLSSLTEQITYLRSQQRTTENPDRLLAGIRQLADHNSDRIGAEIAKDEKTANETQKQVHEMIGTKNSYLLYTTLKYSNASTGSAHFWRFLANLGENRKEIDHYQSRPMEPREEMRELTNLISRLQGTFTETEEGIKSYNALVG